MKVLRNQLEDEAGQGRDIHRNLYDLIWQGVRDKVGGLVTC